MNKILNALKIKLHNQQTEIMQQSQIVAKEHLEIEHQLHEIHSRISNVSQISKIIIPEKEIAGKHFISAQQQIETALKIKQNHLNVLKKQLETKRIKLKTRLKLLEKYQAHQQKMNTHLITLAEQNFIDEWVVQQGSTNEN